MKASEPSPAGRPKSRSTRRLALGLAFLAALLFLREPLMRFWEQRVALWASVPDPDVIEEMIDTSDDPIERIHAAWQSGSIVARQVAVRKAVDQTRTVPKVPAEVEPVLLAGALDLDITVREAALGTLIPMEHPAAAALAAAQLKDADPEVRMLALRLLRRLERNTGVRLAASALNDPSPVNAWTGMKLLEHWSGEEFGVSYSDISSLYKGLNSDFTEAQEKLASGKARAEAWWTSRQSDYPPLNLPPLPDLSGWMAPVKARNFDMTDLNGREVSLSRLKGKVIMLNFWTTWCPPCAAEIPDLIELQKRHRDSLEVIGVCLELVPGRHSGLAEQVHSEHGHDDSTPEAERVKDRTRAEERVRQFVANRGIAYPIILDKENEIGGRFAVADELPATVVIDAKGHVKRRLVGARNLEAFEALLADASAR